MYGEEGESCCAITFIPLVLLPGKQERDKTRVVKLYLELN